MALGSSPPGATYNFNFKEGLSVKKQAVNPTNKQVEKRKVFLTDGFASPPKVSAALAAGPIKSADYYREGKPGTEPGQTFDLLPFSITPFADDDQPASIRVLGKVKGSGGTNTSMEDKDLIPPFTKFILENVQEGHVERSQIVETFGDFYVFFFGERPPMYSFSGTLINTKNVNWLADFMFMYENFLRGTRCVEANARVLLTYGGRQVEGFIMNVSNATTAANEGGVQVSFQVVVTSRKYLFLSSDFGVAQENGRLIEDEGFLNLLQQSGLSRTEVSKAYVEAKEVMDGNGPAGGVISKGRELLGI